MAARALVAALERHRGNSTNYLYKYVRDALVAPAEGICWSYDDLTSRVRHTAHGLVSLGFGGPDGDKKPLVSSLPAQSAWNVLLQLSCATIGTHVVTAKDGKHEELGDCFGRHGLALSQFHDEVNWAHTFQTTSSIEKDDGGHRSLDELADLGRSMEDSSVFVEDGNTTRFHYNGAQPGHTLEEFIAVGTEVSEKLRLREEDRVCVAVPVNHAMGMAFGIIPSLLAGSTIVMAPDAGRTISEQQCTILVADTHVCNSVEKVPSHLGTLRGGLVKVGSGEILGASEGRVLAGSDVELISVGTPR